MDKAGNTILKKKNSTQSPGASIQQERQNKQQKQSLWVVDRALF